MTARPPRLFTLRRALRLIVITTARSLGELQDILSAHGGADCPLLIDLWLGNITFAQQGELSVMVSGGWG
jgi:hypothetical protein